MKPIRPFLAAALATLCLLPLAAAAQSNPQGIEVHDAYARALGASGAVFFTIHNHGDQDVTLTGATTAAAAMAGLHTHVESADGMMQMIPIDGGVPLPSGREHAFARGADHIMLMGLTSDLANGDTVTVTLTFDGADPLTFDAVIENDRPAEAGAEVEGGHGHGNTGHDAAAPDTTGMTDPDAVTAVMMAQFDTPETPLTVDPVVVEGDHALASWAQDGRGGRALLERRHGQWVIVLCGGPDLRLPGFLAENGVSAAQTLSQMYNAAEDALGAEKVALYSSFQGVQIISGPTD